MSFIIYPAIDIRDGKCVRLVQGDYNQETVYNENPLEVAQAWEAQGGQWIHLVDLDGAKAGRPVNDKLIGEIARTVKVPVQVGGGLRTEEDVDRLLSLGVSRVILGTAAIEDRAFVQSLLAKHGENVAIGLDARDGFVATRGWLETSSVKAEDLAVQLAEHGAKTFIFTDISRDGMMGGPNVEAIVRLAKVSGRTVIASGGVSRPEDLERLAAEAANGVGGAIVGKALYTGSIRLEEALKLV
ncbi:MULTISPECIES: 1-(5-phosphoribosyl)-5-[(5-phosphoribosylamino)methylideneamino]imidazole-4-carboxamide isomerase [Paenibacillus]|uniref:1-(5-phosphoribosyl)-5-[(5- phosphoribosylamino)methylideneamino]imidazole-4- carboxamide isomerase n=1 Tax=Paenibacillus TaxID=44249 RepID=UPI00020D6594|nr:MULTISPECIES: 1-(5-phosphoribosyl)-5-[(5-phosphoribosylamino)methylideneamino]imidazole-4-carboxamide isomerase [Paenibacillus]EGL14451.1 1-(5-phosphoribosyl)-5-[(5-phosphoribosylamino)methylideneamino]imidazole-4-carboxamide isomerase [Paenibacillus sp. HGF7]EPD85950.1 1-(5-phosphoribosyl)-5-[(5-phosphoribosylamino)methylideneamino]imidazole-4-carboxamide isomerase [Paenibacillus sp. HGH0039]MBV6716314.1 1-(5-phosphoribosyl)-5-[(5-phosphoribosylamino)methylideneamino]imidazole-4-carboxamide 